MLPPFFKKEYKTMFYKNARIFTSDFQFHTGAFEVVDGKFASVLPENVPADAIDSNLVKTMDCATHPVIHPKTRTAA